MSPLYLLICGWAEWKGGGYVEDIWNKAIWLLQDGANKVEFTYNDCNVTAYWVKDVLRIDVKGLKRNV